MKLYENEAKKIFRQYGIPIPEQFGVVHSVAEVDQLSLKFPLMLKAAVLTGGRGKAGGIKRSTNLEETKNKVADLLKVRIKGFPVKTVFFEEAVEEYGTCYIGATTDPKTFNNVIVVSTAGGVDIEEIAQTQPEAIIRRELPNNDYELPIEVSKELTGLLAKELKLSAEQEQALASIITKVYKIYQEIDAKLCEINPVIITSNGVVAADAKIVLDDNGLYRQDNLLKKLEITGKRHELAEPTINETRAYKSEFPYVDLLSSDYSKKKDVLYVGLVPGGAGYGIFSIDEVVNIGNRFFNGKVTPINFMDSGGGPSQVQVAEMFHLLMDYPLTDVILTSRFGGISSCDIFIRGLIQALRERYASKARIIPVYGRMVGTDLPSAKKYLDAAKRETADALRFMDIIVGNEIIMVDIIKEGIRKGFEFKKEVI